MGNDDDDDYTGGYYSVKHEQTDPEISMDVGDSNYMGDSFGSFNDEYTGADEDDLMERSNNGDDTNYDDLVEESLLDVSFFYKKFSCIVNFFDQNIFILKDLKFHSSR